MHYTAQRSQTISVEPGKAISPNELWQPNVLANYAFFVCEHGGHIRIPNYFAHQFCKECKESGPRLNSLIRTGDHGVIYIAAQRNMLRFRSHMHANTSTARSGAAGQHQTKNFSCEHLSNPSTFFHSPLASKASHRTSIFNGKTITKENGCPSAILALPPPSESSSKCTGWGAHVNSKPTSILQPARVLKFRTYVKDIFSHTCTRSKVQIIPN